MMRRTSFADVHHLLLVDQIVSLKQLIISEPAIVKTRNAGGATLVDNILSFQQKDDPELLHFVLDMEPEMDVDVLERAFASNKPNMLRALIDRGFMKTHKWKTEFVLNQVLCHNHWWRCVKVILDAGATNTIDVCKVWCGRNAIVEPFLNAREKARHVACVMLYVAKTKTKTLCGNGKDVMRMIARVVWESRAHTRHDCDNIFDFYAW